MAERQWGIICMQCGEFIPEPENGKLIHAKRDHVEEEHGIWWHEAVKDEESGEVEKI